MKEACAVSDNEGLEKDSGEQFNLCTLAREKIEKEIQPDPPTLVSKGNVIAEGVDAELDELRKMAYSGKDYLLQISKGK